MTSLLRDIIVVPEQLTASTMYPTRYGTSELLLDCKSFFALELELTNSFNRTLRATHGEKPNITGFDARKFAASAGQPRYDPWERASVPSSTAEIPIEELLTTDTARPGDTGDNSADSTDSRALSPDWALRPLHSPATARTSTSS